MFKRYRHDLLTDATIIIITQLIRKINWIEITKIWLLKFLQTPVFESTNISVTIYLYIFWDKTNFGDFHEFLMRIFGMDELHGFFLRLCSIWQIFAHSSNYWHQSIFVVSAVKFQCRSLKKYKNYTQYSAPYSYLFKFLTPYSTIDENLEKEVLPIAEGFKTEFIYYSL